MNKKFIVGLVIAGMVFSAVNISFKSLKAEEEIMGNCTHVWFRGIVTDMYSKSVEGDIHRYISVTVKELLNGNIYGFPISEGMIPELPKDYISTRISINETYNIEVYWESKNVHCGYLESNIKIGDLVEVYAEYCEWSKPYKPTTSICCGKTMLKEGGYEWHCDDYYIIKTEEYKGKELAVEYGGYYILNEKYGDQVQFVIYRDENAGEMALYICQITASEQKDVLLCWARERENYQFKIETSQHTDIWKLSILSLYNNSAKIEITPIRVSGLQPPKTTSPPTTLPPTTAAPTTPPPTTQPPTTSPQPPTTSPPTPPPMPDKIEVKVLAQDQFGYPVEDAVVKIEGKKIRKWLFFTVKTDKNGIASFELETKKYRDIIEKNGKIKIELEKEDYEIRYCDYLESPFKNYMRVEFKDRTALIRPYKFKIKIKGGGFFNLYIYGEKKLSECRCKGILFYKTYETKFYPTSNAKVDFKIYHWAGGLESEPYRDSLDIDPSCGGIEVVYKVRETGSHKYPYRLDMIDIDYID